MDTAVWTAMYEEIPSQLTVTERQEWLGNLKGVCLGSDAFFPFRDNIDRARLVIIKIICSFIMLNNFYFYF